MTTQATAVTRDAAVTWILTRLSAPFDAKEIKWKPKTVSGNRALALAYLDARAVQDRLDAVVGAENWSNDVTDLGNGSVACRLSIRLGGEWVMKMDVGSASKQPDAGDRMKAAFSDAFKRAAIQWGIGRFLYRLPAVWVDYDPNKKVLLQIPTLPAWAGGGKGAASPQATPESNGHTPTAAPKTDVEAFGKCSTAILSAPSANDLDKYKKSWSTRGFSAAQVKALEAADLARRTELMPAADESRFDF